MRRPGLRFRLLLFVLVAVLPGIGLLGYAGHVGGELAEGHVRDEATRIAQLVSDQQERTIESSRGLLNGLSRIAALAAPIDPARCRKILEDLIAENPPFNNLAVADLKGDLLCAGAPGRSVSVSHRAHYQRALQSRAFACGNYIVAQLTGRSSLYCATPVFGAGGDIEAVVTAGLDLGALQRRLDAHMFPPGTAVVVTDAEGVVLARRPAAAVGVPFDSPLLARMRAGTPGTVQLRDPDGELRVYAHHAAAGPGGAPAMMVAVGIPLAPVRAQVRAVFARTLAGFAVIAIIALAVALAMGETLLVRRIDRIIATARRLSSGELGARTGLSRAGGEMGQLAAAFDEMARSLEAVSRQNQLILDSTGEGLLGLDRERRITFANPAALRALGYEAGELLGRSFGDLVVEEAPADRRAEASGVLVRKDGRRFPAEYVTTPIHDGGAVVGAVVSVRDVSDRRRLEDQLRHAQKMEAVGQLAGGVAHDFNNLLTAILSFARFVKADLGDDHPSGPDVDEILSSGERAATLTRQLLAFSRRQVLEPRTLDLADVVRGVEKMLRRLIGEDIALETRIDPRAGKVRADPGHVEQVILNLAVNARDAMPDGGRLLIEVADVPPEEPEVLADPSLPAGPLVRIAMADTGIGMDEATQARIFEPFFTTKPAGKGTGLGLSTVYGIVRQSGGAVRVKSAPGRGTTFHVYLPRASEDEVTAAAPASAAVQLTGSDHLLELLPGLSVLFTSGYTAGHLAAEDVAAKGHAFLPKPFTPDGLLRRVREVLDGPGRARRAGGR
jgi:PAS domain S-box-containing protein